MVKLVCLKFWAFVLGLAALPMSIKNTYASTNLKSEIINIAEQKSNALFIEPYLDDSQSFQIAGHRSHRSHRSHSSHRSHYSSRGSYGGGYYKTPSFSSSYSIPKPVVTPTVNKSTQTPSSTIDVLVLEIQLKLHKLDFFEGSIDGIYGKKTRNAIILYQVDKGLTPDGLATKELLEHINTHVK